MPWMSNKHLLGFRLTFSAIFLALLHDLRTFVARFWCRDLRTFSAIFCVTEKQTSQTFSLLECMLGRGSFLLAHLKRTNFLQGNGKCFSKMTENWFSSSSCFLLIFLLDVLYGSHEADIDAYCGSGICSEFWSHTNLSRSLGHIIISTNFQHWSMSWSSMLPSFQVELNPKTDTELKGTLADESWL